MKKLLLLVALLSLVSCNKKKEPTEYEEPVDVTLRKPNGDPVGTHRDRNGVIWSDHNIFAPRENESLNDEKFQRAKRLENQYGEGYEQGYEDASNGNDYDDSGGNGQYRKGYEDGYSEGTE